MSEALAWPNPLSTAETVALGEIVVIQSMIEWLLDLTLLHAICANHPGNPSPPLDSAWERESRRPLGKAIKCWKAAIHRHVSDPAALARCDAAADDIAQWSSHRNNFVHAIFAVGVVDGSAALFAVHRVGRDRRGQRVVADVHQVRDDGARLSQELNSIGRDLYRPPLAPIIEATA